MHVRFIDIDGGEHLVEGEPGESVMRCAGRYLIPGIIGECGGTMACATCHGYVAMPWLAMLPPPSDQEQDMLAGCIDVEPGSRLTCQLILDAGLDGLTVTVPRSQT